MGAPTLFLSAASIDLAEWREVLDVAFRRGGFRVLTQDASLRSAPGNVKRLLTEAIAESDCIIHLAGLGYGSEATDPFPEAPSFQCSWTQFEYYHGHRQNKDVIAFVCAPGLSKAAFAETGKDASDIARKQRLQREHRLRVEKGTFENTPFPNRPENRTSNEIVGSVFDLLSAVAAAVGTLHKLDSEARGKVQQELRENAEITARIEAGVGTANDKLDRILEFQRPPVAADPFSLSLAASRVSLGALHSGHYVGGTESVFHDREVERRKLTEAWENTIVNVAYTHALGGVGKTALLNKWIREDMGSAGYRGAQRVFGYSFDKEGASVDDFLMAALGDCGDPAPGDGDPIAKARRLVKLLRQQRCLLVLDAAERIMFPRGAVDGSFNTKAMGDLVLQLAAENPGLLVMTTRMRPVDLGDYQSAVNVLGIELENLPIKEAEELLRKLKVVESAAGQLESIATKLQGHCLSLKLVASYLIGRYHGRAERFGEVLLLDDQRGDSVKIILSAYVKWLAPEPELVEAMRTLGLFDRSVSLRLLGSLWDRPLLGLSEKLAELDAPRRREVLVKLHGLSLLDYGGERDEVVDSHPMVREYFRQDLELNYPKTWTAANAALVEVFKAQLLTQPKTREELDCAYQVVRHGCRSGQHASVWREVFWDKIRQNTENIRNFNLRTFRAFESDLSCLREFLSDQKKGLMPESLESGVQARILMELGCDLRALGQLDEAEPYLRRSYVVAKDCKRDDLASEAAANSAELAFRRCSLHDAESWARLALTLADDGGSPRDRVIARGVLGNILHHRGFLHEAVRVFADSESIASGHPPEPRLINGVHRFNQMDLLLSLRRASEVEKMARAALDVESKGEYLMIGLTRLALGLALLELSKADASRLAEAAEVLEQASADLVSAGRAEYMPRRALARSALERARGTPEAARQVLNEALLLARAYGLKLSEIDILLESVRLNAALGRTVEATADAERAKELIITNHYTLRESDTSR